MNEIEARGKIKYRIANEMRKAGENKEEYEDLEIALQVMKEIREYRELGTVEEFKALMSDAFTQDVLNMGYARGYNKAIDDFVTRIYNKLGCSEKDIYCIDTMEKILEQMKGGATDEG